MLGVRTHTPTHRDTTHKAAHIFHTRTLYGIVSISVTAEGLATRDCAGLSRHGPDFTGYKGSRLPLVSNSVLDKKNVFCLKKREKKIADYHNRKIAAVQFWIRASITKTQGKGTRAGVIIKCTIFRVYHSRYLLSKASIPGYAWKEHMPRRNEAKWGKMVNTMAQSSPIVSPNPLGGLAISQAAQTS